MPLEQLYAKSPMEQFEGLSLGSLMGMQPEEFGQYKTRQQEYNQQIDELNRRASEINPHIVEQQRLENQKNQYLMPTHQYKGMEAQTQMSTPGYLQGKVGSELAGFGAATAKSNVEQATNEGLLPYAKETAATQGRTTLDTAKLNQAWVAINNFDAEAPDAEQTLQQLDPQLYQRLQPTIAKHGMPKTKEHLLNRIRSIALSDPKHIQAVDLEARKPKAQGSLNQAELALMAAGGDPLKAMQLLSQQGNTSEAGVLQVARAYATAEGSKTVTTAHLDKARTQIQQFETSTKTHQLVIGPDGKPMLVEQTTKGTPPPSSSGGGADVYTVLSGDTPKSIADKHHVTYEALVAANPGLNNKNFRVGYQMNIPKPGAKAKQVVVDGVAYDVIAENSDGSKKIRDPKTGKTGTYRQ